MSAWRGPPRLRAALADRWRRVALVRVSGAGLLAWFVLDHTDLLHHHRPDVVPWIGSILAALVIVVALRGLFARTWTRRLALTTLIVETSVAMAFVWVYAYDPRNYAFALIPAVCVDAVLTLGLGAGLLVWALASASYVVKELFALRLSGHPAYPAVEVLRISLALVAAILAELLHEGAAVEREGNRST